MLRTSLRVKAREEKGRECGKVWDTGVPNKPVDDPYPAFFKPSTNCTYNVDGQIVYIQYPTNRQKIIDYIHRVERFDQTTLLNAPNGVYTWILYKKKDDPNTYFASARVKSIVEMGTLHFAVARGVEASTIHGAGELKKVGKDITFNFLSGSFMQKWIPAKALCTLPEMEVFIRKNYLEPIFPRTNIYFTKETIIAKYFLKVPTMEEIQTYADEGFVVCVHPKENKDQCLSVKGTCAAPLKPREETTMVKKGGISGWIGLTDQGEQVPVDDPKAVQWMNTRTYESLPEKPSQDLLDNPSKRLSESQPPSRSSTPVPPGSGRKKTRKPKKSRKVKKVTRRRKH